MIDTDSYPESEQYDMDILIRECYGLSVQADYLLDLCSNTNIKRRRTRESIRRKLNQVLSKREVLERKILLYQEQECCFG